MGALNVLLYIHRHRVCLVDLQFALLVGRFGSSSLATLLLSFNCGFLSTSACGSSTGVCACGALEDLGLPQGGPGVEVVQLLVAGVLAAPSIQQSWQLGQQEI